MEKRAIFAILLTILVILFWTFIQPKIFPPPPSKPQPREVKKEEVSPQEKLVEKETEIKESKLLKGGKTPAKARIVPPKEVSIETQNYWAVFTSEDARLKHFKLKKYHDRVKDSELTIKLTQFINEILGKKVEEPKKPEPLDLVNTTEETDLP
jgi:YidC/Oxa1 family membrane protein insertase